MLKKNYTYWTKNEIHYILTEVNSTYSSSQKEQLRSIILSKTYNIADFYFEEPYQKEWNNNDGSIVKLEKLDNYQKRLGKLK